MLTTAVLSYLFILASSVCKSLLISALTQGVEPRHLPRLTCSVLLWGGRNTANKYLSRECLQCMDHTGFAPAHRGMCFLGLHCLGSRVLCRALSKAGPAFCALPRSKLLRFSGTPQGHRLVWASILCPSEVGAAQATRCLARALSQVGCASYHLPSPSRSVSLVCHGVPSQLCISSGELTSGCNLLAGVNRPGSQVDVVSSWGAAHSLVEDAVSGAETGAAPCLPALALACLPLPWQGVGGGLYAAGSLSFDILLVLCSVSGPGYMLEPSMGKFSLSLFFLSSDPPVWVAVSH